MYGVAGVGGSVKRDRLLHVELVRYERLQAAAAASQRAAKLALGRYRIDSGSIRWIYPIYDIFRAVARRSRGDIASTVVGAGLSHRLNYDFTKPQHTWPQFSSGEDKMKFCKALASALKRKGPERVACQLFSDLFFGKPSEPIAGMDVAIWLTVQRCAACRKGRVGRIEPVSRTINCRCARRSS